MMFAVLKTVTKQPKTFKYSEMFYDFAYVTH